MIPIADIDRIARCIGNRTQYPWRFSKLFVPQLRASRRSKRKRGRDNCRLLTPSLPLSQSPDLPSVSLASQRLGSGSKMNLSKISHIFLRLNQSRVPASLETLKVSTPHAVKVAAATTNLDDFVEDLKDVIARRPYQN